MDRMYESSERLYTMSDLKRELALSGTLHTLTARANRGRLPVPPYDFHITRSNGRKQGFWDGNGFATAIAQAKSQAPAKG